MMSFTDLRFTAIKRLGSQQITHQINLIFFNNDVFSHFNFYRVKFRLIFCLSSCRKNSILPDSYVNL